MNIYLVSLKSDVKRREELKNRFPKYYDSFKIIEAVDGRLLSSKEYFEKTQPFFSKYQRIISPAEFGCTLSHIKVLKEFLRTDSNFALILEDDVIGDDEDILRIKNIIDGLDTNSIILCGGQDGLNSRYQFFKETKQKNVYEVSSFSYAFIYRTCCYIVSKTSAKNILDYHENLFITIADKWDVFFKNTNTKIYYSKIFKHPEDLSNSHIELDRKRNNKTFIRKLFSKDILKKIILKFYYEFMCCILLLIGYKRLD